MSLTITNGTPQQQRWVQDAITACSYPINDLGVAITVQFVDPLPNSSDLGHAHSYMVTEETGVGTFTISIATWADDPGNPNNQGLPNPAQDINDFFKASFVHELGHVVHFSLVSTDQLRQSMGSFFWTTDITGGSGRRYGILGDWSSTTWVDNMMEAVADTFKCAFYGGRLVFENRTHWNIDEPSWPGFLGLLGFSSSGGPTIPTKVGLSWDTGEVPTFTGIVGLDDWKWGPNSDASGDFFDDFSVDHLSSYAQSGGGPQFLRVSGGELVTVRSDSVDPDPHVIVVPAHERTIGVATIKITDADMRTGNFPTLHLFLVDDSGTRQFDVAVVLGGNVGPQEIFGQAYYQENGEGQLGPLGNDGLDFAFPLWVAVRVAVDQATFEFWLTDPALGGLPTVSTAVAFDDTPVTIDAAYPFGTVQGSLQVGSGARGQLVAGR